MYLFKKYLSDYYYMKITKVFGLEYRVKSNINSDFKELRNVAERYRVGRNSRVNKVYAL